MEMLLTNIDKIGSMSDIYDINEYRLLCGEPIPFIVYCMELGVYLYVTHKYPNEEITQALLDRAAEATVVIDFDNKTGNEIFEQSSCCGGGEVK